MLFKDILRELRIENGYTQKELADKLGVSMSIVTKWENGKKYPSLESLKLIAKFSNESLDYLTGLKKYEE